MYTMNIYCTKIKLRAAANQAIYLVIFRWVVGNLYLHWYINLVLTRFRVFLGERSHQSLYMSVNLF